MIFWRGLTSYISFTIHMAISIKQFITKIKDFIDNTQNKIQSYSEDKNIINSVLFLNFGLIGLLGLVIAFLDTQTIKAYTNIRSHISTLKEISENYELALIKSQVTLKPNYHEIREISQSLDEEKKAIDELGKQIPDNDYLVFMEKFTTTLEKRLAVRDELFARYDSLYSIYKDYRKISTLTENVLKKDADLQVKVKHIMLDLESVRLMAEQNNRENILQKIRNIRTDIINSPPDIQEKVSLFTQRANDIIGLLRYLDTIRSSMRSDGYSEQLSHLNRITAEKIDAEQFYVSLKLFCLVLLGVALCVLQFLMITWFFISKRRAERVKAKAIEQIESSKMAVIRAKQYALDAQRGQFKLLKNFCSDFSSIIDNISHLTKNLHISHSTHPEHTSNHALIVHSNTLNDSVEALEVWLANYLNIHIAREDWREAISEKMNIEKIINDIFVQSRFYASHKEHDMSIYHKDMAYEVFGDAEYIKNIYMNLVYISLKWSHSNWMKTSLEISEYSEDEQHLYKQEGDERVFYRVKMSMIDYSSDEDFAKRKERFEHQSVVEEAGSGNEDRFISAALYFSRQIGDILKAKFSLERTVADECILSVSMPMACKPIPQDVIGVPILQNKSAIIVSPYSNVLYTLETQLKSYGMNISAISDRYAAIGHIVGTSQSEDSFDIVILDHHPPEIDALMLAKVVRENSTYGLMHIIVITTGDYLEELEQQARSNIDAIILKPIRPSELKKTVENFIEIQLYGPKDSHENEDTGCEDVSKRILAVMNEDLSSTLIKLIVTRQNFQIDIASTSTQVMELLDVHTYDMIIVSNKGTWIIPDTIVKDIRRHHSDNKDAVVFLLYEELKKSQYNRMVKAGYDDFIELPLSKNVILEKIEEWENPSEKRLSKSMEQNSPDASAIEELDKPQEEAESLEQSEEQEKTSEELAVDEEEYLDDKNKETG